MCAEFDLFGIIGPFFCVYVNIPTICIANIHATNIMVKKKTQLEVNDEEIKSLRYENRVITRKHAELMKKLKELEDVNEKYAVYFTGYSLNGDLPPARELKKESNKFSVGIKG